MFEIRNSATIGFDRAMIAMRREHGGREASDSGWSEVKLYFEAADGKRIMEYNIGPEDKAECLRQIAAGYRPFMYFVGVWAHIEAPAEWWSVYGGYFPACSDVSRTADSETRSVLTTYGHLRNLLEVDAEIIDDHRAWAGLREAVAVLPESWMLLDGLEEGRA